mgnify:CR=1 FL=1
MNVASCGQGMGKVSPLHSSYEKGDAMTEEFYESHASCVHGYDGRACATADEGYWGDEFRAAIRAFPRKRLRRRSVPVMNA